MRPCPAVAVVRGQALVEMLVLLVLLGALVCGVALIGRLQHNALQAGQASRHAAFMAVRGQSGGGAYTDVVVVPAGMLPMPAADPRVRTLAQDWLRINTPSVRARVRIPFASGPAIFQDRYHAGFRRALQRHTTLWSGAGHASHDRAAQQRLDGSALGWSQAAHMSAAAARALKARMQRVDAPWGRGTLLVDWLLPWADLVPHSRLAEH